MSIDVLNFLQKMSEAKTPKKDSLGVPGIDAVSHSKQAAKDRTEEENKKQAKNIEDAHIERMRRSLSRIKTEVFDCQGELGPDQFRFCMSQSGKKDLEVSHRTGKKDKHSNIKLELKGKKAGGRTEASQYALALNTELEIPQYDKDNQPVTDESGKQLIASLTPKDYLEANPVPVNKRECLQKCSKIKNTKRKIDCQKKCDVTKDDKVKVGRTDIWNPSTIQPISGRLGILKRSLGLTDVQSREAAKDILAKAKNMRKLRAAQRKDSLKHTIANAIPKLMASLGTHATISGNDENISVIHHYGQDHPDRNALLDLLRLIGLESTHEVSDITGTSGSPHITYPTKDDETGAVKRGSHAMLRISHRSIDNQRKELSKKNAEFLRRLMSGN